MAADKAAKGQQNALNASASATSSAEGSVRDLFGKAQVQQDTGINNAMDFLNTSIGRQIQPFQQGNMAAQEQVSSALPQINNAIMGNPVDFSGFAPKQISQPSDFTLDFSAFRKQPAQATQTPQSNPNIQDLLQTLQIGRPGRAGGFSNGQAGDFR
jgi:hypothetical protein